MQTATQFKAEPRERIGKGGARALRRAGFIPATLYAKGGQPVNFALEERALKHEYGKGGFFNKIIGIESKGKVFHALTKDLQFHPVTDRIEHVDFLQVDDASSIRVLVPVRFRNQEKSPGLKRGGVLNVVRHELELVCAPKDIPQIIEIDIAEANIGDSIHISHVALPEGVQPAITDRDFTIATIAGRSTKDETEVAAATTEGAEAAPAAAGVAAPAKAAAAPAKAAPAKK
jgi:large subunit ribosomal protein L25